MNEMRGTKRRREGEGEGGQREWCHVSLLFKYCDSKMQICIKNAKHYKYTATVDTSNTILHKTSYSANDYQTK